MKRLEYLLREGFIEIIIWPKDLIKFSRRMQVYLNNTKNVKLIDTSMGKAIVDTCTGDMIVLDMEIIERYGAKQEVVNNLDVDEAIYALEK